MSALSIVLAMVESIGQEDTFFPLCCNIPTPFKSKLFAAAYRPCRDSVVQAVSRTNDYEKSLVEEESGVEHVVERRECCCRFLAQSCQCASETASGDCNEEGSGGGCKDVGHHVFRPYLCQEEERAALEPVMILSVLSR